MVKTPFCVSTGSPEESRTVIEILWDTMGLRHESPHIDKYDLCNYLRGYKNGHSSIGVRGATSHRAVISLGFNSAHPIPFQVFIEDFIGYNNDG
jgi:hypothetical protein